MLTNLTYILAGAKCFDLKATSLAQTSSLASTCDSNVPSDPSLEVIASSPGGASMGSMFRKRPLEEVAVEGSEGRKRVSKTDYIKYVKAKLAKKKAKAEAEGCHESEVEDTDTDECPCDMESEEECFCNSENRDKLILNPYKPGCEYEIVSAMPVIEECD